MNIPHSRQGDGTYVSLLEPDLFIELIDLLLDIDLDSVFDLFEVRQMLEAGAAYLAADRILDSELDELRECLRDLKRHPNDLKRFLEHPLASS